MTTMKAPNSTNVKCMSIGEPNSIFNAPDFRSLSFSRLACLPEKPQKFPHLVSCNSVPPMANNITTKKIVPSFSFIYDDLGKITDQNTSGSISVRR
ncbi:hypothetical protein Goari_013683 [Gossypium aridum]|uniref:Uncharacterized protein n=1 Tax=Gossypium aridum TaxID=34290 RepID=A0A7J8XFV7_GOSAI|nr:hypothetical protein [Gossypium aridum]